MIKEVETGILDAIGTCAARAGVDPRISGHYSPDVLLWEATQVFIDRRTADKHRIFLDSELDAGKFITSLVNEAGLEVYLMWRSATAEKMAALALAPEVVDPKE